MGAFSPRGWRLVRLAGGVTLFLIVGMLLVLRKRSGRAALMASELKT